MTRGRFIWGGGADVKSSMTNFDADVKKKHNKNQINWIMDPVTSGPERWATPVWAAEQPSKGYSQGVGEFDCGKAYQFHGVLPRPISPSQSHFNSVSTWILREPPKKVALGRTT